MNQSDRDDELRARLRAADPAAGLPPADQAGMHRLLEDIMSHDDVTPTRPSPVAATWLVGAAACLVVLGIALTVIWRPWAADPSPVASSQNGGSMTTEPTDDASEPDATGPTGATETLRLTAPDVASSGRCAPLTRDLVAYHDTAFRGRVLDIAGNVVTLKVLEVYAGEPTGQVEVAGFVGRDAPRFGQQTLAPRFRIDQEYLIASYQGTVGLCGVSGPATEKLTRLYEAAF